jgi:hypothetical protein
VEIPLYTRAASDEKKFNAMKTNEQLRISPAGSATMGTRHAHLIDERTTGGRNPFHEGAPFGQKIPKGKRLFFGLSNEVLFIYSSMCLWGIALLGILVLMDRVWTHTQN